MSGADGNDRDAAIAWVARMDAGDWSPATEAELQTWLAGDARRHGVLLRAQAMWSAVTVRDRPSASAQGPGPAQASTPGSALSPAPSSASDPTAGRRDDAGSGNAGRRGIRINRRTLVAGGAAAVAASVAAGIALAPARSVLRTDLGEIRHVPLADGSIATLNTGSEVDVAIGRDRRSVRLRRGEAWFQVAKDRTKPFVVESGPIRVLAVGTAFSVRRREGGADVVVTEGTVEIWSEDGGGGRSRLTEGERAFLPDSGRAPEVVAADAPPYMLAWRSGRIELVDQPLDEAVAEFNRYNQRRIVLVDPRIGARRIDGLFRTDDVAGFAEAVKATLDVPVDTSRPDEIRIGETIISRTP